MVRSLLYDTLGDREASQSGVGNDVRGGPHQLDSDPTSEGGKSSTLAFPSR